MASASALAVALRRACQGPFVGRRRKVGSFKVRNMLLAEQTAFASLTTAGLRFGNQAMSHRTWPNEAPAFGRRKQTRLNWPASGGASEREREKERKRAQTVLGFGEDAAMDLVGCSIHGHFIIRMQCF